jgi:uncharacterized secreted protein with C-terminal beta-propeller domain
MKTQKRTILPLITLLLGAVGCDSGVQEEDVQQLAASLQQAQNCDHLLSMLKQDALAKMNAEVDAQIQWIDEGGYYGGGDVAVGTGSSSTSSGGEPTNEAAPSAGSDSSAPAPSHSETNTQVDGVDEADIVKTDGNYLYVLHGGALEIVTAFPASDMALSASLDVEGSPSEMFLTDDKLVVFATVDGTPIFEAAGVEPPTPDYGYGPYPEGDVAGPGGGYGYYPSLTKITVLGHQGSVAQVERELYFEGHYQSSRRMGELVRAVLNGGHHSPVWTSYPEFPNGNYPESDAEWKTAYAQLRVDNTFAISAATLDDFLPRRFEKDGANVSVAAPSCTDYYVPPAGSTTYGLTQVQSFDLASSDSALHQTYVVGHATTVYANADSMYLASEAYNDSLWATYQLLPSPVVMEKTHLHKLDLATNPAKPDYVASGTVPGRVDSQFSLDEKDGMLRISTTATMASVDTWDTINNLFVLGQNGGKLTTVGSVTGLAPGEQIYSTRFVGDRGYVVTFRQVDPLFVFDLSNPAQPELKAELKIPGFSEYMHPLNGGTHLLTIGQDGTDTGQITSPALQIFDVQDATNPVLTHKLVLPDGYSEALYNHKAFTFYEDMLAIPFSSWGYDPDYSMSSTLELFDIDVTAGITHRGSIDHTAFFGSIAPTDPCYYAYPIEVRRGVFIGDNIYAISAGGVTASRVSDLSTVATLNLPSAPIYDEYCYYY